MANRGVLTKTDVPSKVEAHKSRLTNLLEHLLKNDEVTFEDWLQWSFMNSNNRWKKWDSPTSKKDLIEIIHSAFGPPTRQSGIEGVLQTKLIANQVVKAALPSTSFISSIT